MADNFKQSQPELDSPAGNAVEVTTSDSTDLTTSTRAIYIGGTGDIKVTTVNGDTVTFKAVPVGSILPVRARRIFATGTTATFIVGLY